MGFEGPTRNFPGALAGQHATEHNDNSWQLIPNVVTEVFLSIYILLMGTFAVY